MDGLLQIHSYWAQLESSLGKDLVAARGVWESLLKIRFDHLSLPCAKSTILLPFLAHDLLSHSVCYAAVLC